jgi:hypothetical protein
MRLRVAQCLLHLLVAQPEAAMTQACGSLGKPSLLGERAALVTGVCIDERMHAGHSL